MPDVTDDDEDAELVSSLLLVDLALGMDMRGWGRDVLLLILVVEVVEGKLNF